MHKQTGSAYFPLLIVLIWIVGVIGWVMNLIAIAGSDCGHLSGLLVIRLIGVFVAPIGSVLGLFF